MGKQKVKNKVFPGHQIMRARRFQDTIINQKWQVEWVRGARSPRWWLWWLLGECPPCNCKQHFSISVQGDMFLSGTSHRLSAHPRSSGDTMLPATSRYCVEWLRVILDTYSEWYTLILKNWTFQRNLIGEHRIRKTLGLASPISSILSESLFYVCFFFLLALLGVPSARYTVINM